MNSLLSFIGGMWLGFLLTTVLYFVFFDTFREKVKDLTVIVALLKKEA